ncbi:hypothetical protein BJ741DRAFT_603310 [Chytriomyces cf. hyalinus JEL632]|nr:hypothetical protein BJ741DRAFT_603310 [Chytriomyces cf. hyalinus JEL632]
MGNLNLDALINDLDATLHELQVRDEPAVKPQGIPTHADMMAQQELQLKLQQQLIEAQTVLLRQQQQLNPVATNAAMHAPASHAQQAHGHPHHKQAGVYQPVPRPPPHVLPQRSQEVPRLNLQHQQEQFNEYNKNLRTWTPAESSRKGPVFSPADSGYSPSNADLQSLLSASSSSIGIDGGGVFGTKDKSDSVTVTSSEKKKRGWFGGSGSSKENAKDPKDLASMIGTLENAGF